MRAPSADSKALPSFLLPGCSRATHCECWAGKRNPASFLCWGGWGRQPKPEGQSLSFSCVLLSLKSNLFLIELLEKKGWKQVLTEHLFLLGKLQVFGSGLTFIAKAWAGLMQAASTAMFIQGKSFLYFTLSPAAEGIEKRVSYQWVHLAFCAGSATAPAGQGKWAQPGQGTTLPDEHVAVISKGRRKESLPAPAAVVSKKIKGIRFYSSTNPSREVLKGLGPEPKYEWFNLSISSRFLSLFNEKLQHKTKGVLQNQLSSFGPSPTQMHTQLSIEMHSFSVTNIKASFPYC